MDTVIKIYINNDMDIIVARMQARDIAKKMGFATTGQARFSLAASELARALCWTNEPNELVISPAVKDEHRGLQVVCLVQPEYVSANGNGDGENQETVSHRSFSGAFKLVDESSIDMQNDQKAQVTLIQWLK